VSTREHVLIVGSMAFDDLELPTGVFPNTVGGSATYSAFAARRSPPARRRRVVGDDFDAGHSIALAARGIDTEGIERAKGKTFRWAGRYDADLVGRTSRSTRSSTCSPTFQPKIPAGVAHHPARPARQHPPGAPVEVLDGWRRPPRRRRHDELLDPGRAEDRSRRCSCPRRRPHHQRRGGARALRHPQHPQGRGRRPQARAAHAHHQARRARRAALRRGRHLRGARLPARRGHRPDGRRRLLRGRASRLPRHRVRAEPARHAPRDGPRDRDRVVLRRVQEITRLFALD
jgi:hypothetical protein